MFGRRVVATIILCLMVAVISLPAVQSIGVGGPYLLDDHIKVERLQGGGSKISTVSMQYFMIDNGYLWVNLENHQLSTVRIEFYDVTDESSILLLSERISFGGDKTGTARSSVLYVLAGNSYMIAATPGGGIGKYAMMTSMFEPHVEKPVPEMIILPPYAYIGQEVRMDGSQSYDPDGIIVDWQWDFGDGSTESGQIVTHTYTVRGEYLVTLAVIDNDGLLGSKTQKITITDMWWW